MEGEGGERRIFCLYAHGVKINFPVSSCSKFYAQEELDIYDLREIAWIVNADKKTGKIGFTPPKDRNEESS